MPTNFPAGSDNFTVPNSPGSTALSSSGSAARNHVQSHKDLGDTIVAMQVEATLAIHSHDGVTARHGNKLLQVNTHQSPDTDAGPTSLHHTLGTGANQAAPGNHSALPAFAGTHPPAVAWPVGCIYISTLSTNPNTTFGFGTWSRVQDAFLIGTGGSYSYSGSVVNNTSTHGHTIPDTDAQGSHSHTLSGPTDTLSTHKHSGGTSGNSSVSHYHSGLSQGQRDDGGQNSADSRAVGASGYSGSPFHSHSGYDNWDNGTGHTHSVNDYDATGSHSHGLSSGVTGSTHSHSVSTNTPSHVPPYQAFYVWRRTA